MILHLQCHILSLYWSQYYNSDPSVVFFVSFSFRMCATRGGFWHRWRSLVGSTGSTRPSCECLSWPVKTRRREVLLIDQETWWATTHSCMTQWKRIRQGFTINLLFHHMQACLHLHDPVLLYLSNFDLVCDAHVGLWRQLHDRNTAVMWCLPQGWDHYCQHRKSGLCRDPWRGRCSKLISGK